MAINLMDEETAIRFELMEKIEKKVKELEAENGSDEVSENVLIPIIDTFFRGVDENGNLQPRRSFSDIIRHSEKRDLEKILEILNS